MTPLIITTDRESKVIEINVILVAQGVKAVIL